MGRHGWNAAPLIPTMKLGICWKERNGPKNGEVITQAAILADKIYRNCKNLNYCKERGIRLSGPALGCSRKGEFRDKAQDCRDKCERVEVELRFRLAKHKCDMGLVTTAKLRRTAAHVIAMSVLLLEFCKIQCHPFAAAHFPIPAKNGICPVNII